MHDTARRRAFAPIVATALALAYPAAVLAGGRALAGVTVATAVAACALVLTRRSSGALRALLAALAGWLALGFAGAFLLQGHPVRGLVWVLVVVYAAPLVVIPWLYAKTFEGSKVRRFEGSLHDDEQRGGGAEEQRGEMT